MSKLWALISWSILCMPPGQVHSARRACEASHCAFQTLCSSFEPSVATNAQRLDTREKPTMVLLFSGLESVASLCLSRAVSHVSLGCLPHHRQVVASNGAVKLCNAVPASGSIRLNRRWMLSCGSSISSPCMGMRHDGDFVAICLFLRTCSFIRHRFFPNKKVPQTFLA